jgi:hypothetical protein
VATKSAPRYFIISIILLAPFEPHGRDTLHCAPPEWFSGLGKRAKRNDDHRTIAANHHGKREKRKKCYGVRDFSTVERRAIIFKMIPFFLFSHSMITQRASSDHQAKGSENEHSPNLLAMRLEVSVYRRQRERER